MPTLLEDSARPGVRAHEPLRSIAVVGGGTAGWMAASILARALPGTKCTITVIESPTIPTVGVGEATIPPIIELLRFLSINEDDFVRYTQSTYKLGIKFTDWRRLGHSYWHPFGTFGEMVNLRPFYHSFQRAKARALPVTVSDFSLCATLGDQGKFRFPENLPNGPLAGLRYALHFDAGLVAKYLRAYSERLGVTCLERTVSTATQRTDGFIDELVFSDDTRLRADLYIDCSGFGGLLIEKTLQTGYLDWRSWLPCDRAIAVQSELHSPRPPHTESFARSAGWRWRIPLQHRNGNGYVYSSAHITDEAAHDDLLAAVRERTVTDPRVLRFVTGRRKLLWNRNCVALGLASGFLEPLESTSIHLVMSGMYKLLEYFPDRSFDPRAIDAYNAEAINEIERIRDFIVLHYCLTQRTDTSLWRDCQNMSLPDSLSQRIDLYRTTGRIRHQVGDLFTELSWFYILEGMGVEPERYDPLVDVIKFEQFKGILASMARAVDEAAKAAPSHDGYFVRYEDKSGTAAR
jgi:tryptophan 7-halogenase